MADYIEGRRAVEEALRAGLTIRRAYVQEAGAPAAQGRPRDAKDARDAKDSRSAQDSRHGQDAALEALVAQLSRAGVPIQRVPRSELDRMSHAGGSHGAHQGIMCEVPPYRYADVMDIVERAAGKQHALVLVLDHITDEGNLGAIIRTAEVIGADGVIIPSKRAAQVTVGVYKTSAGAALHLPVAQVPNLVAALNTLKEEGFWVAGASEHAHEDIWHSPLDGRIALVSGSEGEGISRLVRETCDFLTSLPQAGKVGSLNVAQATTAICYEWLRRKSLAEERG